MLSAYTCTAVHLKAQTFKQNNSNKNVILNEVSFNLRFSCGSDWFMGCSTYSVLWQSDIYNNSNIQTIKNIILLVGNSNKGQTSSLKHHKVR